VNAGIARVEKTASDADVSGPSVSQRVAVGQKLRTSWLWSSDDVYSTHFGALSEPIPLLVASDWLETSPSLHRRGLVRVIEESMTNQPTLDASPRGLVWEYAVAITLKDFFEANTACLKDTPFFEGRAPHASFAQCRGRIARCYRQDGRIVANADPLHHQPWFVPLYKPCDSLDDLVGWFRDPQGIMFALPPTRYVTPGKRASQHTPVHRATGACCCH